jgi:hypothetical protein
MKQRCMCEAKRVRHGLCKAIGRRRPSEPKNGDIKTSRWAFSLHPSGKDVFWLENGPAMKTRSSTTDLQNLDLGIELASLTKGSVLLVNHHVSRPRPYSDVIVRNPAITSNAAPPHGATPRRSATILRCDTVPRSIAAKRALRRSASM